ncbi:MAG: hypothetical protein AAGI24_15240 [Pseudomonadota bacterium]
MSSSFLEIVELPNGDIVLQRAEEDTPLVTIQFSEESKEYLLDNVLEVARAMIQAGIQTAAEMAEQGHIVVTETDDGPDGYEEVQVGDRAEDMTDDATAESIATEAPRVLH